MNIFAIIFQILICFLSENYNPLPWQKSPTLSQQPPFKGSSAIK